MNEYIEAKDLDDFRDEIMSEFLSLCNYNDYNEITLFRIGETIDKIYGKYYSKPLADVESKREWISVTERLPEENARVLVYRPQMPYEMVVVRHDGYNWERWNTVEDKDNLITHWMPLPLPPGKENEDG